MKCKSTRSARTTLQSLGFGFVSREQLNAASERGSAPFEFVSDEEEIELAARKPRGLAPLIRARDKIEPPGGTVLKCEEFQPQERALPKEFQRQIISRPVRRSFVVKESGNKSHR